VNFFEHQARAQRNSRRLLVIFVLAVIAIVVAADLALLLAAGLTVGGSQVVSPSFWDAIVSNVPLLVGGAVVTTAVILLSSLYRIASLSGGGGGVAQELGGVLVDADTADPLRRRLRNVVEEMALASGVPVPAIYVLEQEPGINAFAAGYTPSDAAVAVTRGALEHLSRDELQGVIAHEFSHLLNGDMRLNIRLMGALFGILVLALAGRKVLTGVRISSGGRKQNGGGVALVALALMIVGYVGLFFGRWIKAGVSRQREFLADASAVQFTRFPGGIAGALKKIAAHQQGARLVADSEEVAHMLFGQGFPGRLFATHPPVLDRIRRIEPGFDPVDLQALAVPERSADAAEGPSPAAQDTGGGANLDDLIGGIGQPGWQQVVSVAALAAALPRGLLMAARSVEWAPEALLRILLDEDSPVRDAQLLIIAKKLGSDSETQVRYLLETSPTVTRDQRLPLLEIAFPAIRRRPRAYLERFQACVDAVVHADGRVDAFEYLLAKTVDLHLADARAPQQAQPAGRSSLHKTASEASVLLGILAGHGHADATAAEAAWRRGLAQADLPAPETASDPPYRFGEDWSRRLDAALPPLDLLAPAEKERLLKGMLAAILDDGRVVNAEIELLRAAAAALHIPLPLGA
jgi:Zn-dependent protease with chaperone function